MSIKQSAPNTYGVTGSAKIHPDEKGRIAIPSRLRDHLLAATTLTLTLHPHGCLSLYTDMQFAKVKEQILASGNMGYFDSHLEEIIIGCAETITIDNAGRITISSHLRERTRIKRDVLLFGVGESVRIWDEERWEQRNTLMTANLQDDGISEPWKNIRI